MDKIEIFSDKIEKDNIFFKIVKSEDLNRMDSNTFPKLQKGEIVENLLVKGVFQDRVLNSYPQAYMLVDNYENLGMKYYRHKSLTDNNEFNAEDPFVFSLNKDIYFENLNDEKIKLFKERDEKIILRVYFKIADCSKIIAQATAQKEGKLQKEKKNKERKEGEEKPEKITNEDLIVDIEKIADFHENKNYKHLLVFENELKAPSNIHLISKSFDDWVAHHEIDMNNWKLVDCDNFMKGNPFFFAKNNLESEIIESLNSDEMIDDLLTQYFGWENEDIEDSQELENARAENSEASKSQKKEPIPEEKKEKAIDQDKDQEKGKKEAKKDSKKDAKVDKNKKQDKEKNTNEKPKENQQALKSTKLSHSYNIKYLYDEKQCNELKQINIEYENFNKIFSEEVEKLSSPIAGKKEEKKPKAKTISLGEKAKEKGIEATEDIYQQYDENVNILMQALSDYSSLVSNFFKNIITPQYK